MTCSSSELKATADLSSAAQSPPPTFEAGGSGAEALLIVFALAAFALGAGYCFYLSAVQPCASRPVTFGKRSSARKGF